MIMSNTVDTYLVKLATIEDLASIVGHRAAMFAEIRGCTKEAIESMSAAFEKWVVPRLKSGEYLTWFALDDVEQIAAGAALWVQDWPPYIMPDGSPENKRAYLLNVFTDHGHRRKGLSRKLVKAAIEWCEAHGISMITLHASPMGRPLYESLGFNTTHEMRMILG
jgi:GNAT superfamily N-acetyltransferase